MVLTCERCGQKNRVAARHLAASARCGACRHDLAPLRSPIDADAAIFDEVAQNATVPVLVDFWAAWCGPCRIASPEVARVADEMAGRVIVLKVDTERHPELASRYGVSSIPNFVVLRDGRVVRQQAGVVPHTELRRWIENAPSQ